MSPSAPDRSESRLPSHLWLGLGLVAFFILASCFTRQVTHMGPDFAVFKQLTQLWLNSQNPYQSQPSLVTSLHPVSFFPLSIFQILGSESARWVYAALQALLAIALPFLCYQILHKKCRSEDFAIGVFVAFLASFRFLDNDFFISQVHLWIQASFLLGIWGLTQSVHSRIGQFLSLFLIAAASLTRLTSLMILLFFPFRSRSTWLAIAIANLLFFFPQPELSLNFVNHFYQKIAATGFSTNSVALQGLWPALSSWFGLNLSPALILSLSLVTALLLRLCGQRQSIAEMAQNPHKSLALFSLLYLFFLLSFPSPMQHQYSNVWVLFIISWAIGNTLERRSLLTLALFLGLTPQGIIGNNASVWLEQKQSVFVALFLFAIILIRQNLRLKKAPSESL